MEIVISIHREWWEKILSGEKTIEVRWSAPKQDITKVWVHVSRSGDKVEGSFSVQNFEKVHTSSYLREGNFDGTCLTMQQIRSYGYCKDYIYLWHVCDVKREERRLSDFGVKAPQSWCYAKECKKVGEKVGEKDG